MHFATHRGVALACLVLASCVDPNDINEIKKNQKQILEKLDEIAKARPAGPQAPAPQPNRPDPSKVYAFEVGDSPQKGPKDAWVTIIGVSEFQCPFCARVKPTLQQIADKYKDDVRFVFKHNPLGFHQRAMPAAIASMCAHEQGKFWEAHDKFFDNQRALEDADLERYVKEVGVDVEKWKKCYESKAPQQKILQDQATAMRFGARGTPAFYINGRFLSGAQPLPAFEQIIDEELKKAKASGIPKSEYFQKAVIEKGEKKV